MSELLLELFSEEIPARLQTRAADDLRRLMVDGLKAQGSRGGRSARLCDAAPLGARGRGRAEEVAGRVGGAQGPARRRARAGGAGLPQGRWPRRRSPTRKSSRTRRRATTTSRASTSRDGRGRDRQRGAARDDPEFPVAEDDALQRQARQRRRSCAGSARCIRSCCCSTARSCRSRSPASRPAA